MMSRRQHPPEVYQFCRDSRSLAEAHEGDSHAGGGADVTGFADICKVTQLCQDMAHAHQACVPLQRREVKCSLCGHLIDRIAPQTLRHIHL